VDPQVRLLLCARPDFAAVGGKQLQSVNLQGIVVMAVTLRA
jgi:hypothetical protein